MSGSRITDQQVRLYMNTRKKKSQELAAAKAGISERSARRIERAVTLPSQNPRRYWRSRPDPFADVWETQVVPLLKNAPKLMAVTLLRKLQDDHPGRFPDGMVRTLQRHIRQWRACKARPRKCSFLKSMRRASKVSRTSPPSAICASRSLTRRSSTSCTTSFWRSRAGSMSKWSSVDFH